MIYMDGSRLKPGSRAYLGVLAHEFQHAVHWNLDSGEEAWINEGLSEVAKELAGYRASFVDLFLRNPDTQLNYWPDEIGTSGPHYGAATLFLSYLVQHYGGYNRLEELAQRQEDGVNGIEAYLSEYDTSFEDVFKDWVVANYLDASEGRFSYPDRSVRVRDVDLMFDYGDKEGVLPQFATRYIDLRLSDGDALVSFEGDSVATQVGGGCHSGRYCWWGNRGDSIDSKLTREFDLSGLTSATLEFWVWFSIEKDWDYAYVEVSADGGDTWAILKGRHTTSENPIGNSFGDAFTGDSDGWVQESIDLTPYTGGKVLVRFEYVTDDTVYLDGFVIDDIEVPALGFFDDAEQDNGWLAEGFKRIDNALEQDYFVQVIEVTADGATLVRDVELDADRRGELLVEGFGSRIEHAVIVISPITRDTSHPARYSLSIGASE
ncbi:MAG: immune inhibitor A [Chloroflexi bacterium]|nr:immune inhibitor A [Chloroflexota bacterium]